MLFGLERNRIDVVICCPDDRAGHVTSALWRALRNLVAAPLEPPHRRPVESRRHLLWALRHLVGDAALDSGSCFADLVGARLLDVFDPTRVRELLPRVSDGELCRMVGLDATALEPGSHVRVRAAGAARVACAAASALAVGPGLDGHSVPMVRARRATVHVGLATGIHADELAWALHVTPRAVRRLAAAREDPAAAAALRLRLALEDAVERRWRAVAG